LLDGEKRKCGLQSIMGKRVKVSASIVLYNSDASIVASVIKEFFSNPALDLLFFLIDNSKEDQLSSLSHLDQRIVYIHSKENLGYGKGHNIALKEMLARGFDYHIVLNPDIIFSGQIISKMVAFALQKPEAGLIMPKIIYPDGRIQKLCKLLPTPFDLFGRRFLPGKWIQKGQDKFELEKFRYNKIINVPFLSGCFMFLSSKAIRDCGGFDDRFFMYGEDIDLSRRIHQKYQTLFYPEVSVVHQHEAASYKSFRMLKIHIANIIKYFNKWGWFFDKERAVVNRKALNQ
jgi:GT2 family glycosyltransferase